MANQSNPTNTQKPFFIRYRIKIGIATFLVLVPLLFIILGFVNYNSKMYQFTFDDESTGQAVYLGKDDLISFDEIKDFAFSIKLNSLTKPTLNDDNERVNGKYAFTITYSIATNKLKSGTSVKASFILQIPILDQKSSVVTRTLYTTSQTNSFDISYNFELPDSYWFKTFNHPILYIKLEYTLASQLNTAVVRYLRMDLNNEKPYVNN